MNRTFQLLFVFLALVMIASLLQVHTLENAIYALLLHVMFMIGFIELSPEIVPVMVKLPTGRAQCECCMQITEYLLSGDDVQYCDMCHGLTKVK